MKAKLIKSDPSNLKVQNKNQLKKEGKKSKKGKTVNTEPDDAFDKQLQDEVRMFLNASQMLSDNETVSLGKKSKKGKPVDDDNNNYQGEHKLLNQKKYATKVLKKTKLKQSNVTKLEKRKKKLKALIQNNVNQDSSANNSLSEQQIKQMQEKIDRKIMKLKEKNENTSEENVQKKQEKVEMKQLFKKFDKLDIDLDKDALSKKSRKKAKFLKLQENSENLDEWKKNKKLARKIRKKEKRLQKHLNNKQEPVDPESKENEKGGKNKKHKKKKDGHNEEETSPPNKKKQKINVDIVTSQINKMDLEETKNRSNKEKKKKKSKKNHEKEVEQTKHVEIKNDVSVTTGQIQLSSSIIGAGGHKKEKYFNSKHTPLREKLMNKLKAARFRYLNEQLYTSKSEESKDFFLKDPESFEAYHEGFKKQVTQWPINPVDIIIKSIEERESSERLVIADLGCGEAKLAASLKQHKVHSLDLVAINERVTPCDMTRTPLKTGSVDIVVLCLSLMGTDLAACIKEANRILKLGGEMKIAEVESRFADVKDFIKDIQKYGFEKKMFNQDYSIFYFLDFKKVSNLSKTKKKKLPPINLKPCLYKKR
ncbi:hypothetical protein WDU94_011720 [Cyamophila willieti]